MKRQEITKFSAWEFVGHNVLGALKGQPDRTISGTQIVAILVAAICPAGFAEASKSKKTMELTRVYLEFYARKPDLTLRLLGVIRKRWNSSSNAARIQKHLLTKAWHEQGKMQHEATDKETVAVVFGEKQIINATKPRQRIKPLSFHPNISPALNAALNELRNAGHDVGLGC